MANQDVMKFFCQNWFIICFLSDKIGRPGTKSLRYQQNIWCTSYSNYLEERKKLPDCFNSESLEITSVGSLFKDTQRPLCHSRRGDVLSSNSQTWKGALIGHFLWLIHPQLYIEDFSSLWSDENDGRWIPNDWKLKPVLRLQLTHFSKHLAGSSQKKTRCSLSIGNSFCLTATSCLRMIVESFSWTPERTLGNNISKNH